MAETRPAEAPGTPTVREPDDPELRVRVRGIRHVRPTGSIAWSEYLEAFRGTIPSTETEDVQRNVGYDYAGLTMLLGHEPRTWRPARFLAGETAKL